MKMRCLPFLVAMLLLWTVHEAGARVFWRSAGAGDMIDAGRIGWREAFSGEMGMNGEQVAVQVLSSRQGVRSALNRIESHFESRGAEFAGGAGDELAWGIALWNDRRAQILIIAPAAMRNTLVFVFHHDDVCPPAHPRRLFTDLAAYPGSELIRTARRKESGLKLEFLETSASSPEVLDYYAGVLRVGGWSPMIADRSGRALPRSMLYYFKGKRVCCISVKSSGTGRGNMITVLQKE